MLNIIGKFAYNKVRTAYTKVRFAYNKVRTAYTKVRFALRSRNTSNINCMKAQIMKEIHILHIAYSNNYMPR